MDRSISPVDICDNRRAYGVDYVKSCNAMNTVGYRKNDLTDCSLSDAGVLSNEWSFMPMGARPVAVAGGCTYSMASGPTHWQPQIKRNPISVAVQKPNEKELWLGV